MFMLYRCRKSNERKLEQCMNIRFYVKMCIVTSEKLVLLKMADG